MKSIIAAVLLSAALAAPAQAADWWWVAGDSGDDAAVFVDGESVQRGGETASVNAVRITRAGAVSTATWSGRCGTRFKSDEIAAVARFACGTDADHMQEAAMLPGLTPREAARAIFTVRNTAGAQSRPRQVDALNGGIIGDCRLNHIAANAPLRPS